MPYINRSTPGSEDDQPFKAIPVSGSSEIAQRFLMATVL